MVSPFFFSPIFNDVFQIQSTLTHARASFEFTMKSNEFSTRDSRPHGEGTETVSVNEVVSANCPPIAN